MRTGWGRPNKVLCREQRLGKQQGMLYDVRPFLKPLVGCQKGPLKASQCPIIFLSFASGANLAMSDPLRRNHGVDSANVPKNQPCGSVIRIDSLVTPERSSRNISLTEARRHKDA